MILTDRRSVAGLTLGSLLSGLVMPNAVGAAGIGLNGGIKMKDGGPYLRLHHLFDGPDGKSKLETLDVPPKTLGTGPFKYLFESAAESMYISAAPPGHFIDWHPARRPQFFIAVQGCIEAGLEDGTKHRQMPGEFLLAEDKNPKGHTSRVVSEEWAVQFCCVLKDTGAIYHPEFPK